MYTSSKSTSWIEFEPQVLPHDLGCDQDDRRAIAIGFIKAVDEVEAAGAAGACAGREMAGELRFGPRRESAGLLMPHMDPIDLAAIDGVGDLVQRVADDPVARLHAGCLQRFDYYIGYSFTHGRTSCVAVEFADRSWLVWTTPALIMPRSVRR